MKDRCVQAYHLYLKANQRRRVDPNAKIEVLRSYAWGNGNVIPTDDLLNLIAAKQKPVLELGCGLGYLASKLVKIGVDVTAVDWAPHSSSDQFRRDFESLTKVKIPRPHLYSPVVEQEAIEYLKNNPGSPHTLLLMMFPPTGPLSFLWRIDWKTSFKGNCIMFAISEAQYDERLVQILKDSCVWRWKTLLMSLNTISLCPDSP